MIARRLLSRVGMGLASFAALGAAVAQEPESPPPIDPTIRTLHAYANLIQMPVLVLGMDHSELPPIKPERFSLTIDGGPPYRPTHVRLEGGDPISLAILLDLNGAAAALLPKIDQAIARLAPAGLTARDHVTIYALHCGLLRTLNDKPADPATLEQAMVFSLQSWTVKTPRHSVPCVESFHLWDSITAAAVHLEELPGRRVIIAITDGEDRGSRYSWQDVANVLAGRAVTLFGLRTLEPAANISIIRGRGGMPAIAVPIPSQDLFGTLSEMSGGMVLPVDRWSFGRQLASIPALLRGRYILEFPRPGNASAGNHLIAVQVAKSVVFIRSTGISVPLPDPSVLADPNTLPSDLSKTPEEGKHKKLPPPL